MPEKIEPAIYGGLSEADQLKIEQATPTSFPNVETAIAWGFEQGVLQGDQPRPQRLRRHQARMPAENRRRDVGVMDRGRAGAEGGESQPAGRAGPAHLLNVLANVSAHTAAARRRMTAVRADPRVFQPLLLRAAQLGKPLNTELVPSEILFQMVLICLCLIM